MATTGKIFQDSSNIYQDEAKVLFNYYQQAAERIVREEERIEKEIANLKEKNSAAHKYNPKATIGIKLYQLISLNFLIPLLDINKAIISMTPKIPTKYKH